jgi:DNA-binding NarL/FixJ family response regulator
MNHPASHCFTVLCVDDNADVASMLESLVSAQPDMQCAGCVLDPHRVVDEIGKARPNVVLLDLTMPGVDTVELIRTIANQCPDSRVLVYSGYDQPETVDDVMAAGAWGLVSKHGKFDQLLEAIRRVCQGEVVLKTG